LLGVKVNSVPVLSPETGVTEPPAVGDIANVRPTTGPVGFPSASTPVTVSGSVWASVIWIGVVVGGVGVGVGVGGVPINLVLL